MLPALHHFSEISHIFTSARGIPCPYPPLEGSPLWRPQTTPCFTACALFTPWVCRVSITTADCGKRLLLNLSRELAKGCTDRVIMSCINMYHISCHMQIRRCEWLVIIIHVLYLYVAENQIWIRNPEQKQSSHPNYRNFESFQAANLRSMGMPGDAKGKRPEPLAATCPYMFRSTSTILPWYAASLHDLKRLLKSQNHPPSGKSEKLSDPSAGEPFQITIQRS